MKKLIYSFMIGASVLALSSCGGSGGSSDGMFGGIPEILENYNQEKKSIESGLTESNYQKNMAKIDELKSETIAKLEKEGEALNGKELAVTVDENELKVETPLTFVYKDVFSNLQAVDFGFDGKIVAAKDLKLEINPSDLKGRDMFGGKSTIVTAKLPLQLEVLDSEGNVIDSRTIGYFIADNNGEEAIVKTGTAVEFIGSFPVSDKYLNVASARLTVDIAKAFASETMPE